MAPVLKPVLSIATSILEVIKDIFDIPILGNIVAVNAVLVPLVGFVVGGVVKMRAGLLQMFGNSTVSAKNMFAVLMGGWKGASLAAADYMRIEGAIIAQRNAGIMGNPGNAVMSGHY